MLSSFYFSTWNALWFWNNHKKDADHKRKITEKRNSEVYGWIHVRTMKLDTEDIVYCEIVLMHLLYKDATRE